VTISDFVADLRAATPSNAAELAVPDQDALRQTMDSYAGAMAAALGRQIKSGRQHLKVLSESPALKSPVSYFNQRRQNVEMLKNRLLSAQIQGIERKKRRFVEQTAKLDAMSPLKVLTRGYAMAQTPEGQVLRSVKQVDRGAQISVFLGDGKLSATVTDKEENKNESE